MTETARANIRPTPEWAKAHPDDVLAYHQRRDITGCTCGWAELGKSHPIHQVAALREAGWVLARADDVREAMYEYPSTEVFNRLRAAVGGADAA